MNSFWPLLLAAMFLRGLSSGMIVGILLLTLPVRSRLGLLPYTQFIRAMYQAWGVRVYAILTGLGLLVTIWLLAVAIGRPESGWATGCVAASLLATMLGFVGTGGAFPTMRRLWATPDEQPALVEELLNRFERWGVFSAACHLAAFVCLLVAAYSR
jgi:hypothetical protein